MHSDYIVLLLGLSLMLVLLLNYEQMEYIPTANHCSPLHNLCVACPHLNHQIQSHPLSQYTQIYSQQPFYLFGAHSHFIKKNQCRDILNLLSKNGKGDWVFSDEIQKDLRNKRVVFWSSSEVSLVQGDSHHMAVSLLDFVVFTQGLGQPPPQVRRESESNAVRLMKMSRCITWGMLIALVLKYLDSKLWIISSRKDYKFPWTQILILGDILSISYQQQSFANLHIAEVMFVGYLFQKLNYFLQLQNSLIVVFILTLFITSHFIHQNYTIFAYIVILIVLQRKQPRLKDRLPHIQVTTAFIMLCLLTSLLSLVGFFNFYNYSAYTSKIIAIPFTFLPYQLNHPRYPKTTEISQNSSGV